MTNLIKDIEYNEDLEGFVVTLNDDRKVEVQFEKHKDLYWCSNLESYVPQVYEEGSDEISDEEEEEILNNAEILEHAEGLNTTPYL